MTPIKTIYILRSCSNLFPHLLDFYFLYSYIFEAIFAKIIAFCAVIFRKITLVIAIAFCAFLMPISAQSVDTEKEQNLQSPQDTQNLKNPQSPRASTARQKHFLILDYENDSNFDSMIDKYYTAGTSLAFVSKEYEADSAMARFLRVLSLRPVFAPILRESTAKSNAQNAPNALDTNQNLSAKNQPAQNSSADTATSRATLNAATPPNSSLPHSSFSITIAQEMYAPKDRFSAIPSPDDYPYSGYLYARFLAQHRYANALEQLSIELGLVGKSALGKQAQNLIHDLTNNARLAGWDTQLRNEFVANLYYGLSYSVPAIYEKSAHFVDLTPQLSLALGNARIHAQTSLALRFGYNLSKNAMPLTINTGFVRSVGHKYGFSIYGFVAAGARFVGRNMFVQGNTFAPHYVTPHNLALQRVMGEFAWGLGMEYKRFVINYSVVHRTREFATQDALHTYGSVMLGVGF